MPNFCVRDVKFVPFFSYSNSAFELIPHYTVLLHKLAGFLLIIYMRNSCVELSSPRSNTGIVGSNPT
jgi:hypothetical protein